MPIAIPVISDLTSLSIQHQHRQKIFSFPSRISHDPLPVDIIRRISSHLVSDDYLGTVASIHRCSKEVYLAVTPILYNTLHVKKVKSDYLLSLTLITHVESEEEYSDSQQDEALFTPSKSTIRRLSSFRHVRHLIIHSLPSDHVSECFTNCINSLSSLVFPNLSSVQIRPTAIDEIRSWSPPTYDRPRNPLFLESLVSTCQPMKLCISFPIVLSEHWEQHRDLTVSGQYQFISRIHKLQQDGLWKDSLKEFNVHNIVHQVLPSLPNVTNNYHFASHITGSESRPIVHPPGVRSVYLPGIQWSYRAWQIGKLIKNLFPSGITNASEIIANTRWNFINVEGHILTKMFRDDDDESGVGHDEVSDLIKNAVRVGLPQDLPLREGFDRELVDDVLRAIGYMSEGECEICHGA
ncbi:hypothetical protein I302_101806 [Kwoniella bestiolae CBS 10118]|uniref:Uncharacterized protein n=1 Tax=Kwoniella bestiolae CBS 10118 TaxID=1296100 RepID=A0A1B9GDA4_9TREE|nr:hypothetical protein I302_00486 [Kwoniella bestiolae CBS 10118]OCF28995.1 hypothetical protein I302_00486 [Kwoniella bestiolae CBS 10118]